MRYCACCNSVVRKEHKIHKELCCECIRAFRKFGLIPQRGKGKV